MNKNVILKLIVAGIAMYGSYKLYKAVEKAEKEKAEKLKNHREAVMEEIDASLHQAEEWNKELKDVTLNNENLKPADRAYAYNLCKERYDAIMNAKTITAIDEARKDFEELLDILINVKEPETLEAYLKMDADKKLHEEKLREEQAARDTEMAKYKALGNVIEKIGTKVVCDLVQ